MSEKGQASEQEYETQMQLATLALTIEFYFDYYQRSLKTDTTLNYVRKNNFSDHKLQWLQKHEPNKITNYEKLKVIFRNNQQC